MEYEFTFVVDGTTVDDNTAVSRLEAELDAMLARAGGQNLLTVSRRGATATEAAMWAAHRARELVPALRLLRLDRDLVGVPEIAERTGKTRQCVHQWVNGERLTDAGPFPLPEGTAGRAHVWLWAEVNDWLRRHGLDDGLAYPTRQEMSEIDFVLANSLSFAFRPSPAEGFDSERKQVIENLVTNHIVSFSQFVANLPLEKNAVDRHILAVAAAAEPADAVMRFIASTGREVVLVTSTNEAIMGVHFTTAPCEGAERVVKVPAGSSVWDWMELVRQAPEATFVPESPTHETLVQGKRLTFAQAPQAA